MKSFMKDMRYEVRWSAEDGEWVATCEQFPSLSCLQTDPVAALSGLIFIVEEAVDDMAREDMYGGES